MYNDNKCLERNDGQGNSNVTNCSRIIEVPVGNILDITTPHEVEQSITDDTNMNKMTDIKTHPDLVGINFNLVTDQSSNALYANPKNASSPAVSSDNTLEQNMCMLTKTNDDKLADFQCVPQPTNRDISEHS